MHKEHYCG